MSNNNPNKKDNGKLIFIAIIVLLVGNLVLVILNFLGITNCSCPKLTCKTISCKEELEPGVYLFDLDTYENYVKLEIDSPGKGESYTAIDFLYFEVEVTSKNDKDNAFQYSYDGCSFDIEFTVNEKMITQNIELDEKGYASRRIRVDFNLSYDYNASYKIRSASGEVMVDAYAGAQFTYDNITYEYVNTYQGIACKRVAPLEYNTKILTLNTLINTSNGKVRLDLNSINEIANISDIWHGTENVGKSVEVIIIKGTMNLDEYNNHHTTIEISNEYYSQFFGRIKDAFPNLKALVIEDMQGDYIEFNTLFPEGGIDIYLEDNTKDKIFTQFLKRQNFVNNVYDLDEFDEADYK